MSDSFIKLKEKALSTDYPRWRNVAATFFLGLMCLGIVGSFWYLYWTTENIQCHKGFLYLSVVWVLAELFVIAYMFKFNNIPKFARDSIGALIAFSNIWFGLFLFSLKPCGV
jgi:hypothetical protein